MRAYVIVPVEWDPDAGQTLNHRLQVLERGLKEHYNETGEQFTGPINVTVDQPDMELIDDVFKPALLGAGKHVIQVDVRQDQVDFFITVEHSLQCRRSGRMSDCKVLHLARVLVDAGHMGAGRHEARLDPAGTLLWGEDL